MALALVLFDTWKPSQLQAEYNLLSDDIRMALLANTYTPNASHVYFNEVNGHEIAYTNYSAGGIALVNKTTTGGVFDADDPIFSALTGTGMKYPVLYKNTGVTSTSRLIGYYTEPSDVDLTNGTYTFQFNASGILSI